MSFKLTAKNNDDVALKLLARLGNFRPNKTQIELTKNLLLRTTLTTELIFHKKLSRREATCLLLAAKGVTIEETAKLLNVKASTVKTWRTQINLKLECKSITQAVFKGIRYGYLPYSQSFL